MRTDNPWIIKSTKIVYENPWMRVREDEVITPLGTEGIYGLLESKDSVMVAVLNDRNELYAIRTFAYPAQSWNWELPGGNTDGEDIAAASKRELEEETGIIASSWELLGKTRVCNGFMTERMAVYLAQDLSFTGKKEVSNEQIDEARFFSMKQIDSMIASGEINDGQSITGIYLVQKWLERQTS